MGITAVVSLATQQRTYNRLTKLSNPMSKCRKKIKIESIPKCWTKWLLSMRPEIRETETDELCVTYPIRSDRASMFVAPDGYMQELLLSLQSSTIWQQLPTRHRNQPKRHCPTVRQAEISKSEAPKTKTNAHQCCIFREDSRWPTSSRKQEMIELTATNLVHFHSQFLWVIAPLSQHQARAEKPCMRVPTQTDPAMCNYKQVFSAVRPQTPSKIQAPDRARRANRGRLMPFYEWRDFIGLQPVWEKRVHSHGELD